MVPTDQKTRLVCGFVSAVKDKTGRLIYLERGTSTAAAMARSLAFSTPSMQLFWSDTNQRVTNEEVWRWYQPDYQALLVAVRDQVLSGCIEDLETWCRNEENPKTLLQKWKRDL